MLEPNEMNQVIAKITSKFAELYSYFPEREKTGIEYNGSIKIEDELRMGYCLHFAALLKEIFPEGHIIWGNVIDHYIFYYQQMPDFMNLGILFAISMVLLIVGYLIFHKLQKGFAEEL